MARETTRNRWAGVAARLSAIVLATAAVAGPVAAEQPQPPKAQEPPASAAPSPPGRAPAGEAKPSGPDEHAVGDKAKSAKAPPPPDTPETRAKLLSDLYAHLAAAESEAEVADITKAIERLWVFSGSATVDLLIQRAHEASAKNRLDLALKLLDAVVDLAPDFAEGWNRRAYVHYQKNDIERALGDLRRAVALEPNHFKAIEGIAQIFKETGRKKAALKAFQELLQINPHASGAKEAAQELAREVDGQGI